MRLRVCLALCAALGIGPWIVAPACAGMVAGEVYYRERVALPADAVLEVGLLDITRVGHPGDLIAAVQIRPQHQVPIPFEIRFAQPEIDARRVYAINASIIVDRRLRFVTATRPKVLTQGNPAWVRILLTAIAAEETGASELAGKTWVAESIGGAGVIDDIESSITIGASGEATGSAACNTLRGLAQISGSGIAFGTLATTRKMCSPAVMEQEARFLRALELAREFSLEGPHLRFLGVGGVEVARFRQRR